MEKTNQNQIKDPMTAVIELVTSIFMPCLGIMAGLGILRGVLSLSVVLGVLSDESATYHILYALSDSFYYFLPAFVGVQAAKRFGIPELEGLAIGVALLYPYLSTESGVDTTSLFGIYIVMPMSGDYTSSSIPVLCAVAFAAFFRKKAARFIPQAIQTFALPLLTVFITYILTLIVVGPVVTAFSGVLFSFFAMFEGMNMVLAGFMLGLLWQILVVFGLHWAITPLSVEGLASGNGDMLLGAMFAATFTQVGACLAIARKTKNDTLKALAPATIVSAVCGVTEPAIYGYTLPKGRPFLRTCLISAIGGALLCALDVRRFSLAGMGIFGYMDYIDVTNGDYSGFWIAIAVSLLAAVASFITEMLCYREDDEAAAVEMMEVWHE